MNDLQELDVDLFGRVTVYAIGDTGYEAVRLPSGWKARLAQRGRQRRAYFGPSCESATGVVRYLQKYGKISR